MPEYKQIDWMKSPSHVHFLSRFKHPQSRKKQGQATYLMQELRENVDHAIQRFLDNGMLTSPTLVEAIGAIHNKPPIEEMLRKHNLKPSGGKVEIIERLVKHAPEAARSMVGDHDLLICTETANKFLEAYEHEQQEAENEAKQKAFEALLTLDGKKAHKIYVEYHRNYGNHDTYGGGNYYAEEIDIILINKIELLSHLSERDAKYLRAASCLSLLWHQEPTLKWLPEDFSTKFGDGVIISNLLRKYAEIRHRINEADKDDKFEISFESYDVDSCALCRKFDGQIIAAKDFPELPDVNCSSQKGCQCDIRHHWESKYSSWTSDSSDDVEEEEEEYSESRTGITVDFRNLLDLESLADFIAEKVEEYVKENIENKLDPLSKLRTIKQMLDEGLITVEEYETTKQRILSMM